jgi:hypothetical protein
MPKKKTKRYRVLRVTMSPTLDSSPVEDWLNEADDEHFMHDVIKENNVVLFIMATRCKRRRQPPAVVTKKKATTKK